mmetsp:Transcript_3705/g.8204  ORF Transcript_3705/g.8204 Transcript_3705/m.8204 type:complete len:224 (-) Transcript_3705:224-895(-)
MQKPFCITCGAPIWAVLNAVQTSTARPTFSVGDIFFASCTRRTKLARCGARVCIQAPLLGPARSFARQASSRTEGLGDGNHCLAAVAGVNDVGVDGRVLSNVRVGVSRAGITERLPLLRSKKTRCARLTPLCASSFGMRSLRTLLTGIQPQSPNQDITHITGLRTESPRVGSEILTSVNFVVSLRPPCCSKLGTTRNPRLSHRERNPSRGNLLSVVARMRPVT